VFASNAAFSLKPSFVPEFNQKFEGHVLLLLQKQKGFARSSHLSTTAIRTDRQQVVGERRVATAVAAAVV
jgi:hypothetical protein